MMGYRCQGCGTYYTDIDAWDLHRNRQGCCVCTACNFGEVGQIVIPEDGRERPSTSELNAQNRKPHCRKPSGGRHS